MTTYKVASDEGATLYETEVGDDVDLDLDKDQERALLAAGWLEHPKKKKEKEG